ncbi:MAG: hypothetical protein GWN84_20875 [Gammaproteobacteria bacterium]|nr:hypothetical protein [Gammaproteobacteria bacterium]NIR85215.1 hypothetical protein [Gammaproteobacteria bacterium]NIU06265.1 hypothetical protein [Gammaproteobacteria bacterium]NIX87538.1 hypothetical protein [Gammaproteobacteria bacterium]
MSAAKKKAPAKKRVAARKRGRPTIEITQRAHRAIVRWLKDGNYFVDACAVAGYRPQIARQWLLRGGREIERRDAGKVAQSAEEPYVRFLLAVEKAEAHSKATAVRQLTGAGREDWRAALAYLERKFPREWGQRINHHVDEELNAFLNRLEANLPADVYAKVLRAADGPAGEGSPSEAPPRD